LGSAGRKIGFNPFLVGRFPKILPAPVFRCGHFFRVLVSVGRCTSTIGFDRPQRYTARITVHGGCAWGTLACAGFCVRRSVNPCTAATIPFDSGLAVAPIENTAQC
jgi:hypothetical protein